MSAESEFNDRRNRNRRNLIIQKAKRLKTLRKQALISQFESSNVYARMTLANFEHFREQRTNEDKRLEFIDDFVYMTPSPSIKHQRISRELLAGLHSALKQTACEVFDAPTDLVLKVNNETNIVIPDLFVVCNLDEDDANRVTKTPKLIIEILSKNRKDDEVTKLIKYQQARVPEYWIVDPEDMKITQYILNSTGKYPPDGNVYHDGTITSEHVPSYTASVTEIVGSR
ncbi:Uma2 family endonuclease [Bacillus sp. Marseille-P3800]|uniref:Uma2 family endonuclease n=1 Tax=Bacillus sp. Marseille-P3800 TaxID=2014782 RepID=UPI000C08B092|nr:Uma2 family endonuclease [Bacillus sp. Marseille-P3800]